CTEVVLCLDQKQLYLRQIDAMQIAPGRVVCALAGLRDHDLKIARFQDGSTANVDGNAIFHRTAVSKAAIREPQNSRAQWHRSPMFGQDPPAKQGIDQVAFAQSVTARHQLRIME